MSMSYPERHIGAPNEKPTTAAAAFLVVMNGDQQDGSSPEASARRQEGEFPGWAVVYDTAVSR